MREKIAFLWRYYKQHPIVLAILLLLTPVHASIAVLIPKMFGLTIDYLKSGVTPDDWLASLVASAAAGLGISMTVAFALAFVTLGASTMVLYAVFQSTRAWMNCRLEWHFRQDAFDQIATKGPDFFNKFRTGDLVTRLTDDVAEKLSWFACSGIFRLYEAVLYVVFMVAMMVAIDPVLTLWTAGPLPILILIFFRTSSLLDKRYDWLQARISDFNDIMEACFSGVRVVKAYVREKAQKAKFDAAAEERREAEIASVKITRVVDSLYHYIWQLGVVIVLLAGGWRVLNAGLSIGELAAFIYYTVWLVFPMFDIGQFLVKSRQSAVSINRLTELENLPAMVADNGHDSPTEQITGELRLDGVSFSFPGSDRSVLDDISLDIPAGHTVALVGKIGAGKSWLVNMLPRLVDPTGGKITLDGHDLRKFRLEDLRGGVGYVPQEPVLFSDSIRNNIVFGREHISEAAVDWAVEVSQLKGEVDRFPNGLDTEIGVRGMSISGGQKQRLALARALVDKPRILILDDCTSALDSRTEAALWARLHEVMPDLTAVLITHRPDTLQRADRIFVLEDGRVIEQGRHDELMNNGNSYAKIYRRYQLEELVK